MSVETINPSPPCCIAIESKPSVLAPRSKPDTQNEVPTAITISSARVAMTVNNAIEHREPA